MTREQLLPLQPPKQMLREKLVSIQSPQAALREVTLPLQSQDNVLRDILLPVFEPYVAQSQALREAAIPAQITRQRMQQRTLQTTSFDLPAFEFEMETTTPYVPFLFGKGTQVKKKKPKLPKYLEGFLPQIKRKGEWKTVGIPTTEKTAKAWAAHFAMQTPARSFRVIPAGKPAKRVKAPRLPFGWEMQFRQPKTPSLRAAGAMVEKSKFALREREEFLGITQKGLRKLAQFPELRKSKRKRKGKRKKWIGIF